MSRTTIATAALAVVLPLVALAAPSSAAPAPDSDAPAYDVTARINTRTVVYGDSVRIRGTVAPLAVGEMVEVQVWPSGGGPWQKVGRTRVKRSGAFVLEFRPKHAGYVDYRVVKPGSGGHARGVSEPVELGVYAYEPLVASDPPAGGSSGVELGATALVNTYNYGGSIVLSSPGTRGYVEYTLGRRCLSLGATFALTDHSPTGARGVVSLSLDGAPTLRQELGTGTIAGTNLDVTGVFRVRFDLEASADPAGTAVVAAPAALCLRRR